MNDEDREKLAAGDKLSECPLCGGKKSEKYAKCFHCCKCGYLQCCDYEGYYKTKR